MAPEDVEELLARFAAGDSLALEDLFAGVRPFMRRVNEVRMDRRLRARIDPSDVVQEALVEANRRIHDYLGQRPMPFHLWLRQLAFENLLRLRRFHVNADRRSVSCELPLSEDSSLEMAREILAKDSGPLKGLLDQELAQRIRDLLEQMPQIDREVLVMRCFEGLSNQEVALTLGLEPSTASQRFGRALARLAELFHATGTAEYRDDRDRS
jgi:RNA polymerase sigma-70 factor (ECF subfamily)